MDIDSAIIKCNLNKPDEDPFCGRFVREMTNDLKRENDVIMKICAGRPKNYGYIAVRKSNLRFGVNIA